MTQFYTLGLAESLLKSIKQQGFTSPTPIQSKTIPALMQGSDLMGIAHTGGGKTAAFALPLLNKLIEHPSKPAANTTKALILAPTRELAQQIGKCVTDFSKGTKLNHLVIAGGLPYGPQIQKLRRGVDVLIATPGRLMDHLQQGNIRFDATETYILDEADRMLDMGFIKDVMSISAALPESHQTVLFSATMNNKVRKLSKELLRNPVYVEIEQETSVAETIDHKMMTVVNANKRELLLKLLKDEVTGKSLVFTRTKRGADRLSMLLGKQGIEVEAIHGDKRQRVREKILRKFRNGSTDVLVATDLAARGIDVDGITHVINYELPIEPENYVHRVGRTGRAGNTGIAISFCDPGDVLLLRDIERLIGISIAVEKDQPFHVDVAAVPVGDMKKPGGGRGKGRKQGGQKRRGGPKAGGFKAGKFGAKNGADKKAGKAGDANGRNGGKGKGANHADNGEGKHFAGKRGGPKSGASRFNKSGGNKGTSGGRRGGRSAQGAQHAA